MAFFDKSYILKTMEECELNNRPNYQKLIKHLKENESSTGVDKEELDYDAEMMAKKDELNNLKRTAQEDERKFGNLNVYREFVDKVESQHNAIQSSDEYDLEQISLNMEKELKSLEMIQMFMKKNKSNETKLIEVDESSLVKANEILKHICEKQK